MSEIKYSLIIKDTQNDKVTTYGYRTQNEAIKVIRQERVKYKSDKSYRGDYGSKKGLSFSTDTIECEIVRTDELAFGIGRATYIVCVGGEVCSDVVAFGKYEDAKKFYDELLTRLQDAIEQIGITSYPPYDIGRLIEQRQFRLETGIVNISFLKTGIYRELEPASLSMHFMLRNSGANLGLTQ